MANKKYKLTDGNMWATDGIHDFGQNKTQREINAALVQADSELSGAINAIGTMYIGETTTDTVPNGTETSTKTLTLSNGLYLVTFYGVAYGVSADCTLQFAITFNNTSIQTALRIATMHSANTIYRCPLTAIVEVTGSSAIISSNIYQNSGSTLNTESSLTAVRLK